MISLSPGLAQGCFDLIEIASRRTLRLSSIALEFTRLGGMPSKQVIETAETLNWLKADGDGIATVTVAGARLMNSGGYEARLRQALLDYIDVLRPAWIQNASFGRARVLKFAGKVLTQVFVEAGLADGTEDNVIEFWDTMGAIARGQHSDVALQIGRTGERLTLAHEKARTGHQPKWVAVDNNADGYDVLSVVSIEDTRILSIEVKATTVGMAGRLHLSANEWERALLQEVHVFHLWVMGQTKPKLATLSREDVEPHVPLNQGQGEWESVEIPFGAFAERFVTPAD